MSPSTLMRRGVLAVALVGLLAICLLAVRPSAAQDTATAPSSAPTTVVRVADLSTTETLSGSLVRIDERTVTHGGAVVEAAAGSADAAADVGQAGGFPGAVQGAGTTPTEVAEPTATPAPTGTPVSTATPVTTATPAPTATPEPTPTPEPAASPTVSPTVAPTETVTDAPTPEVTPTPTPTTCATEPSPEEPAEDPTAEPSVEPTAEPTAEPTPTPSPTEDVDCDVTPGQPTTPGAGGGGGLPSAGGGSFGGGSPGGSSLQAGVVGGAATGGTATAAQGGAVLTGLADVGSVVEGGTTLYTVEEEPVVVLPGTIPAWRTLDTDSDDGPDIEQLETALVALGYGEDLTVDESYTSATAAAVEDWETDLGRRDPDGAVDPEEVVVMAVGGTVLRHEVAVGSSLSTGTSVLTIGNDAVEVHLDVPATDVDRWAVGVDVDFLLDEEAIGGGTLTELGRTVTADGTRAAVVAVSGGLPDLPAGTPVTLSVTVQESLGVLAVPASAVHAGAQGHPVVTLPDGTEVDVTIGVAADGLVEVTGIEDGTTVLALPG